MKSFIISLLTSLLIFSHAFAQVINAEFKPADDIAKIKEGDMIEATVRVWPIENADLSQFKKLEKSLFFNAFYLAQITNLGVSTNNADVVELKGIFVVKTAKPQTIFSFKYNETPIEVRLGQVKIEELKDKSQSFYILDQSLNGSYILIMVVVILAALVVLAIIKRKALKEFIQKMKPDAAKKSRKKYDELFRVANKREDFELIYQDKEIWLKLLAERAPAHNEFLKTLNQHQFKKEWGNEEYSDVRSSFDIIRRSFEK